MVRKKIDKNLEEFKYLIDSRSLSSDEKKEERDALLKAREKRFRQRSENEIKTAKLLQLKYQMEEYLSQPAYASETHFPKFLRSYINTLYDKQKNFASDISVEPLALSHILNKHREPTAKFLFRLSLHSQDSYRELCKFEKELWFKVYYQDKVCQYMLSSDKWEQSEAKHVRGKVIKVTE